MSKASSFEMPSLLLTADRSPRVEDLWLLRMLVRLDGASLMEEAHRSSQVQQMMKRLGIDGFPARPSDALRQQARDAFQATLLRAEEGPARFRLPRALQANLTEFGKRFGLGVAEREIVMFALMLQVDEVLAKVAHSTTSRVQTREALAIVLGRRPQQIDAAMAPSSNLRRSGLMRISQGWPLPNHVVPAQDGLGRLALRRVRDLDQLFLDVFRVAAAPRLELTDFGHFQPHLDLTLGLIRDAVSRRRKGVNLLLYGSPGTGKTELSRVLARAVGVECLEVSGSNSAGDPLDPLTQLCNTAVAQRMLSRRRALLVFDEVEAIFNDGSGFFGRPSTAETHKSWVNALLEQTPVPTVWIANKIHGMDPAFLRRFDMVAQMSTPPISARARLVRQLGDGGLTDSSVARIAQCEALTPAMLQRAASVARRVAMPRCDIGPLMEVLLDGNLRARGQATVSEVNRGQPPGDYDPSLCNADHDLDRLATGVARSGTGRIVLSGPPGTGKTAFGQWLAQRLERPLLFKRVADLQSPFLGEMEARLAEAFREAVRENAVLQIDEVDSFLRNRREATQSWQVSQVNEFLTRLEGFEGVLVATTNLMDSIDEAALRRFDVHVRIGPMRNDQMKLMLERWMAGAGMPFSDVLLAGKVGHLSGLTPGDFARLSRRHRIAPMRGIAEVVAALESAMAERGVSRQRIGFV